MPPHGRCLPEHRYRSARLHRERRCTPSQALSTQARQATPVIEGMLCNADWDRCLPCKLSLDRGVVLDIRRAYQRLIDFLRSQKDRESEHTDPEQAELLSIERQERYESGGAHE